MNTTRCLKISYYNNNWIKIIYSKAVYYSEPNNQLIYYTVLRSDKTDGVYAAIDTVQCACASGWYAIGQ